MLIDEFWSPTEKEGKIDETMSTETTEGNNPTINECIVGLLSCGRINLW
jgi:hypothetical protein